MNFQETKIAGSYVIDVRRIEDPRGFFGRTWCRQEMGEQGLSQEIVQVNTALSLAKGTLRGMHFQRDPHAEVKIVSCPSGAVFDVVLDLRPESPTYCEWFGVELSGDNFRMLYIPEGCAHGYQTLQDNSVLNYTTSVMYAPDHATGVRYDDPAFGIEWPQSVSVVSDADAGWPDFSG
jgi:dTDP-4-dehydrorhamnose 3,5-epimerase